MSNKEWRKMSTAERLRAFAWCMNDVIAELLITAADELDELSKKLEEMEDSQ